MADDIDIEEHDISENPRIKDILPHCTIKTEPDFLDKDEYEEPSENYMEYKYYEGPEYDQELEERSYQEYGETPEESYAVTVSPQHANINNKIILGTKPCSQSPRNLGSVSQIEKTEAILNYITVMEETKMPKVPLRVYEPKHRSKLTNALQSTPNTSHELSLTKKIIIGTKPCPKSRKPEQDKGMHDRIVINPSAIIFGTKPNSETPRNKASKPCPKSHKPVLEMYEDVAFRRISSKPCPKSRKQNLPNKLRYPSLLKALLSKSTEEINVNRPERVLEDAIVYLEDWSSILESSESYCGECKTLFATRNALDAHNMTAHSFLVAIDEADMPESPDIPKVEGDLKTDENYCNQCHTSFADGNLLIQHLYEHLTGNPEQDEGKLFYKCPICFSLYLSLLRFKKHTLRNHSVVINNVQMVCFAETCDICDKPSTLISYNKHIQMVHREFYQKKVKNYEPKKKTVTCNVRPKLVNKVQIKTLPLVKKVQSKTQPLVKKVQSKAQPLVKKVQSKTQPLVKKIQSKPLPKLYDIVKSNGSNTPLTKKNKIARYKCIRCPTLFTSKKYASMHMKRKHSNEWLRYQAQMKCLNINIKTPGNLCPIPANVIFKCQKCTVHLLNATTCNMHLSRCPGGVSGVHFWTCNSCKRTFRRKDRFLHKHQHKVSNNIKTYAISDNLQIMVIWKCDCCNVYFEDSKFFKHWEMGCDKKPGEFCPNCKVNVDSIENHAILHKLLRSTKSDCIFIDEFFIPKINGDKPDIVTKSKNTVPELSTASTGNTVNEDGTIAKSLKRKLPPLQSGVVKKHKMSGKMILYYCEYCYTFSKRLLHRQYHIDKKCIDQKNRGHCKFCGLLFNTGTPLVIHTDDHRRYKWKFQDYHFYSLINTRPVTPEIPVFPTCNSCNVQYIASATSAHQCNDVKRGCTICKKFFNVETFKLHQIHHRYLKSSTENYEVSELIKKYKSIKSTWNNIYVCSECELATESYDTAVRHAQKHLASVVNNRYSKLCKQCSLNFDVDSMKKHQKLHSNKNIDKSSFNILKYNYEVLLTDDWFKMFENLSESEIKLITSPSIYVTRSIKMKLILDGPSDFTIYKCESCKCYVDQCEVLTHARFCIGNVTDAPHLCSVCDIPFNSADALHKHKSVHKKSNITANSYRIVAFNAIDDRRFNNKLNNWIDCEQEPEPIELIQNTGRVYLLLQCQQCKNCSPNADFYKGHNCSISSNQKEIKRWSCPDCPFISLTRNKPGHIQFHEDNENVTRDNVVLVKFDKRNLTVKHSGSPYVVPPHKVNVWFQCVDCKALVTSTVTSHTCDSSTLETCSECQYKFSARSYKFHIFDHMKNKDLSRETIHVVPFKFMEEKEVMEAVESRNRASKGGDVARVENVYKCACGLHFTSERNVLKHSEVCLSNLDIVSEQCKECCLLFPTDDLPIHLSDQHSNGNTKIVVQPTNLYKCSVCVCHFLSIAGFSWHHSNSLCDQEIGVRCGNCNLVFHQESIDRHRKMHGGDDSDKTRHKIVTLGRYKRPTLYKCNLCKVHCLDEKVFRRHLMTCNNKILTAECRHCGLLFAAKALLKHYKLHHASSKMSARDFVVVSEDAYTNVNSQIVTVKKEMEPKKEENDEEPEKELEFTEEFIEKVRKIKMMYCTYGNKEFNFMLHNCWCGVCCLTKDYYMFHSTSDHNESKEWCTLCGYVIPSKQINIHMDVHHKIMGLETEDFVVASKDDGQFVVKRKQVNENSKPSQSNCIYECGRCGLNFLTLQNTFTHYNACNGMKFDDKNCDICTLNFTASSLFRHKIVHHDGLKYSLRDFYIFTVMSYSQAKDETNKLTQSTVDETTQDTLDATHTTDLDESSQLSQDSETKSAKNKESLFRCVQCNVYFVNYSTGQKHILYNNHRVGEVSACDRCGLVFPLMSGKKHQEHHDKHGDALNLMIHDLDIVSSADNLSQGKVLYTCTICRLNFFCASTLHAHMKNSNHKKSTSWRKCEECGLMFTVVSLSRHMKAHHGDKSLRPEDFEFRTFNDKTIIVKSKDAAETPELDTKSIIPLASTSVFTEASTSKSILDIAIPKSSLEDNSVIKSSLEDNSVIKKSLEDNSVIKSSLEDNSVIKSSLEDISDDIAISESRDDIAESDINAIDTNVDDDEESNLDPSIHTENVDKLDNISIADKDETVIIQSDNAIKSKNKADKHVLYKCAECNVYFLTQNTCYYHVYSHIPLDSKEYIDCKYCFLPFKILSLYKHIQIHHDSEFELSKVLVHEYTPRLPGLKTQLKVETYYATDKVQSRLVSTTTDDDKVEPGRTPEPGQSKVNESIEIEKQIGVTNDEVSENSESNVLTGEDSVISNLNERNVLQDSNSVTLEIPNTCTDFKISESIDKNISPASRVALVEITGSDVQSSKPVNTSTADMTKLTPAKDISNLTMLHKNVTTSACVTENNSIVKLDQDESITMCATESVNVVMLNKDNLPINETMIEGQNEDVTGTNNPNERDNSIIECTTKSNDLVMLTNTTSTQVTDNVNMSEKNKVTCASENTVDTHNMIVDTVMPHENIAKSLTEKEELEEDKNITT